jgi:hypothetical protein
MDSSPQQRHDLLVEIDQDARAYTKTKKKEDPATLFQYDQKINTGRIFYFGNRR